MERLQKFLANRGIDSRRKCEQLIKDGKVSVNGKIIKELGFKVDGTEQITVNKKPVKKIHKEYYLLYKPKKYVSTTSDEKNRPCVVDLIKTKNKIYPVGRLDYDTTGILLLTNDGDLTNKLTHPKFEVEKEYQVKIDGLINLSQIKELENGILLDGIKTKKAKVRLKRLDKDNKKSYLKVTITEGRYHQVKKMFEYFSFKVVSLKRTKYAFLNLNNLNIGCYRSLTELEIKKLLSL